MEGAPTSSSSFLPSASGEFQLRAQPIGGPQPWKCVRSAQAAVANDFEQIIFACRDAAGAAQTLQASGGLCHPGTPFAHDTLLYTQRWPLGL